MREAVIVASGRTPLAKSHRGSFNMTRPDDLAAHVIRHVLERVPALAMSEVNAGSDVLAWVVAGALFALVAAIVLYLLVMSTPRPRSFFGWVVALATVILAMVPCAGQFEIVPAILAAIVWVVIGCAVWSLLTGTLSRTVVRRTTA